MTINVFSTIAYSVKLLKKNFTAKNEKKNSNVIFLNNKMVNFEKYVYMTMLS